MNPLESAVAVNNERVVIRGVDCRSLGDLGMPLAISLDYRFASSLTRRPLCRACARVFIIERNVILSCICPDYKVITS